MQIAIVDDEQDERTKLSRKIELYMGARALPYTALVFTSGDELLESSRCFDLIFLDIRMNGLSGMETAQRLRQNGCDSFIVFVTALQEYVYDAFSVTASDYLLKPLDDTRFARMMGRILDSLQSRQKRSLVLASRGNTCHTIALQDILYCEAVNHRLTIHTTSELHGCSFKMEELESRLDDRFFRCHRSYLVNLDYVCGYRDGLALLENRETIPVSRLRGQEFSLRILQRMKKGDCYGLV